MTDQQIDLTRSLTAWGSQDFDAVIKYEIEQLDASLLPLQQGLSASSYVSDSGIQVMIVKASESDEEITVKTGIFYTGIIAGCNCADDPSPVDEVNEYCEVNFVINRETGLTRIDCP